MFATAIQIFILLAPFFILSVFVSVTDGYSEPDKRRTAVRTTLAILTISLLIYFAGNPILKSLGITLDAFRVGAGLVLLLSGLEMVRGGAAIRSAFAENDDNDVSIVPLAIPCAIGPGTTGALLMMGGDALRNWGRTAANIAGIAIAVGIIGILLYFSGTIERLLKRRGISVLSKLTGLFLAALASQIIFEGVRNLLFQPKIS